MTELVLRSLDLLHIYFENGNFTQFQRISNYIYVYGTLQRWQQVYSLQPLSLFITHLKSPPKLFRALMSKVLRILGGNCIPKQMLPGQKRESLTHSSCPVTTDQRRELSSQDCSSLLGPSASTINHATEAGMSMERPSGKIPDMSSMGHKVNRSQLLFILKITTMQHVKSTWCNRFCGTDELVYFNTLRAVVQIMHVKKI